MNSKASSELETKLESPTPLKQRDELVAARLCEVLSGISARTISMDTGYNPETVRRYMNGNSKIPADFVAQVVRVYEKDLYYVLDVPPKAHPRDLQRVPLSHLLDELSRRICRLEDFSVGSVLLGQQHPLDRLRHRD